MHEHDWTRMRNAVSGKPSNLEVCRVEGCTAVRGVTYEVGAEPDEGDEGLQLPGGSLGGF